MHGLDMLHLVSFKFEVFLLTFFKGKIIIIRMTYRNQPIQMGQTNFPLYSKQKTLQLSLLHSYHTNHRSHPNQALNRDNKVLTKPPRTSNIQKHSRTQTICFLIIDQKQYSKSSSSFCFYVCIWRKKEKYKRKGKTWLFLF